MWQLPRSYVANDEKAAYTNARWPWVQAVWKVYIRGHLPRQSHVVRVEFPRTLTVLGPHIVHFLWRGYTGCIDVDVLGDDKVVLNTSRHMMGYRAPDNSYRLIKYDHTAFDVGTYGLVGLNTNPGCQRDCVRARRGCWVVPPPGHVTSEGMTHEEVDGALTGDEYIHP